MHPSGKRCALITFLAAALMLVASTAGFTQDSAPKARFYMAVFAQDTNPRAAQTAHTFATFVKTDGEKFEAHTISWLPRGDNVKLLKRPEPGVNLDLKASLDRAAGMKAQVFEWGPFEIKPALYDLALKHIALLNSGKVLYKAVDLVPERGGEIISNCIHAVTDIDMENGRTKLGPQFGVDASEAVVEHLSRWIIDPKTVHPEINEKLGLGKRVKMQNPPSRAP